MAVDILGDEIVEGEFVIQIRTGTITPLYCCSPGNQLQGISVGLQRRTARTSSASKLVKVTREAMQRLLLRNPLPSNLYTNSSGPRRHRVSARYVIAMAEVRRQRVDLFYRTFMLSDLLSIRPVGATLGNENAASSGIIDLLHSMSRPLLALPVATVIPPVITPTPNLNFLLALPVATVIPPVITPTPNLNFINIEGQSEEIHVVPNTSRIKSNKPAKLKPSEFDLDFDD